MLNVLEIILSLLHSLENREKVDLSLCLPVADGIALLIMTNIYFQIRPMRSYALPKCLAMPKNLEVIFPKYL